MSLSAPDSKVRVLLVDDDEEDVYLARECLEDEVPGTSFDVIWADNYEEAFEHLIQNKFDVCLLDMHLGIKSGLELLQDAKSAGSVIPAILLTGAGGREVDMEATAAGAADYIEKSKLTGDVLERSIRYAIQQAKVLARLRESEARTRMILDSAIDAIISTDGEGNVESFNRGAEQIFGYSVLEASDFNIKDLIPRNDADGSLLDNSEAVANEHESVESKDWIHVIREGTNLVARHNNGNEFPVEATVSEALLTDGRKIFTVIARDITERKRAQEALEYQALHDDLTGLPNRALFFDRVQHAFDKMTRVPHLVAVFLLDLDGFKALNDTLGHQSGDDLLVEVAERLRNCVRPSDTVARLGGDEFVVLCEELTDEEEAYHIADRLVNSLNITIPNESGDLKVGASVGLEIASDGIEDLDVVMNNADTAMYSAKDAGRGQWKRYNVEMEAAATDRRADPNAR